MSTMELPEVLLCKLRGSALGGCLLCALAAPVLAAEIRVDDDCSLVDAIDAANSDTSVGWCPAGSGADRIVLTTQVVLTSRGTFFWGWNALHIITTDITIDGQNHFISRSAAEDNRFRFFGVDELGTLTLENVVIDNGREHRGGAVLNEGVLHVRDSILLGNSVFDKGGAIFNFGDMSIENTWIWGNSAGFYGGGIYNAGGATVSVLRSLLGNNDAPQGGAVYNGTDGTLYLTKCDLQLNEANVGAGVYNEDYMWALSTLFSDNTATGSGGALFNASPDGDAYVLGSTFSANTAFDGGGIFNQDILTVALSTFSGNTSTGPALFTAAGYRGTTDSTSRLESSIITDSNGGAHCGEAQIIDWGANLGCHGDEITHFDVTLRDNGGSTRTHAIQDSASNAVDAAGDCGIPADQRGVERSEDCDSGAFEYGLCGDDVLRDQDIDAIGIVTVCEHLWIGPNVEVLSGGHLFAQAGGTIIFRNGFSVANGGVLTAAKMAI